MLNNKADFILEYNERSQASPSLKRKDIDWSQSRVLFISPEFTKYQHAIGFKDFGIQLWEIHKYKNGIITFNEVKSSTQKESITTIAKTNPVVRRVSEEIKVYTEDGHLTAVDDKIKELYTDLKSAILSLGKDIEVSPKKFYIAFRRKQRFAGVAFQRSKLKAFLNIHFSDIQDPLKKTRANEGAGNTSVTITDPSEIPYVLTLIKQAYEKN